MLLMQHIAVAQFERTIHQTLPTDSIKEIHFNLLGQLDVQPWAGNGILTETHIILENGSPQLLEQIIKQGRYLISTELKSADNLMLKHGILEKSRLRYKNNEAIELSLIHIYTSLTKYLRLNIHFIQNQQGYQNFTENDDGLGNINYNGYQRAKELITIANHILSKNHKMWLPAGNRTIAQPIHLQYVLTGVFFHADQTMYRSGSDIGDFYNSFEFNRHLGKNIETEINFYLLNNYEKAKGIASGIACDVGSDCRNNGGGLIAKLMNDWLIYQDSTQRDWSKYLTAMTLNHEIGHLLGLQHSWGGDDCPDTPEHANCWGLDKNKPNCNEWSKLSNNMMDYNEFWHARAVTPCQIEKMHQHLNTNLNQYIHSCGDCLPANASFNLKNIRNMVWLDARASFRAERYRVQIKSIPSGKSYRCV